MIQYSLATAKNNETIIKVHHDYGDFNFYIIPSEDDKSAYSWASDPVIKDKKIGDIIAQRAVQSIAIFAKNNKEMTFKEMLAALKQASIMAK